ncbi:recombinase family protein [Geosporobacter ferrireducens]|uniref:recombinase family protein n=1 Tax=Geosporobacter ferrireducens TaxID=1424294 RepID=UPI0023530EF2|nr:recombinase family protein [Geosporobacter ferrireducens]
MSDRKKTNTSSDDNLTVIIRRLENRIYELTEENTKLRKRLDQAIEKLGGQKPLNDPETIKKIFIMYLDENKSLQKITEELTRENTKTKRGGKWYRATVKYILENTQYVKSGYITEEMFKQVQEKLRKNRRAKK